MEEEWSTYRNDNWTKKLIGDACTFKKCKRNIDHWTMELLAGYEILNVYHRAISKEVHSRCWDATQKETTRSMRCDTVLGGSSAEPNWGAMSARY